MFRKMERVVFEVAEGGANVAVANCSGTMEADTIQHGRSSTSLKGRGNFFNAL